MTDWGAHHNDIAYWAIGLLAPRDVESAIITPPVAGGYTTFSEYEVRYTYANGTRLNIFTTKDDSIYGAKVKLDGQRNGIRLMRMRLEHFQDHRRVPQRHRGQCERTDPHGDPRDRHVLAQAAHVTHVLLVVHGDDD